MIILGIETSCDETALSLLETKEINGKLHFKVLHNAVLSQIKLHEQYGGVFPMMAKREHAKNLAPLLLTVLKSANFLTEVTAQVSSEEIDQVRILLQEKESILLENILALPELFNKPAIDMIAVTNGPGLEPALWVGINFAKALGILWNVPIVPTNHMEGHIVASLLQEESHADYSELRPLEFPALALLISGGHTELVKVDGYDKYTIVGKTRDDAVGEAFDKVARLLGLPYPGGPQISKLAAQERIAFPAPRKTYPLPRPMLHSKDLDFSFSGIKTAVLYTVKKIERDSAGNLSEDVKQQIAREFEDAAVEVLVHKTEKALMEFNATSLIIGGGVIANSALREAFTKLAAAHTIPLLLPHPHLSTDNALMIAIAGALHPERTSTDFIASGNMSITTK